MSFALGSPLWYCTCSCLSAMASFKSCLNSFAHGVFSFSIKNPEQYNNVISHIDNFHNENLKDSFIFDFYLNEKFSEIKVGVRLIFQSPNKTLSHEDIQMSIDKILRPIICLEGVFIPGLELK